MPTPYVHLHTHSHYSLLDGLSKVPELVSRAKELGMDSIALTDHGAMYGAIEFYTECKKAGIKPIIGVEAYMAERSRKDMEPNIDSKRYHLTLLAKNNAGYKNLMKLVSKSNLEGYYYKPRMDMELLEIHSEGIICLSGCPGSRFINHVKNDNIPEAKKLLKSYIEIFGKENVYVEVMHHKEVEWYIPLLPKIVSIAKDLDLPIVGTWDSHYLHTEDAEAQDTLVAINTGTIVGEGKISMKAGNYSLISGEEAKEIFKDIPGAVENTVKLAESVNLEIELSPWRFPTYPIPEGSTYDEELRKNTLLGLKEKSYPETEETLKRIDFELDIIKNKGFSSYFLVEADLVKAARTMGIYTNTRGSAAGSLVSYLTGITTVDPLKYKIPFERFLNPLRPGIPDIDLDIADDRRDDLIGYVKEKYGTGAVAQICTFGTMAARGSVRDVARALGYPYNTGDTIAKLIPMGSQGFPMTIDHALEITPELQELYDTDRPTKEIIDMAKKIEGNVRHISIHAAGVVISPTPDITEYTPIQYDPKGENKIITQYDMFSGGRDGVVNLPKFDMLGIRNLQFITGAIERIEKIHGVKIDIDNVPLDDKKVFKMLARGETVGVFQMAGDGMTHYIKELRPTKVEDLMAMVALYRPGPMEVIPEYIKRKDNPSLVTYPDPRLKDDLEASYGLLVYQDDVLLTAIRLAGYTWLDADKFRKAMGKKIPAEMAEQKDKFYKGCKEYGGLDVKKIDDLWQKIEPFAAYGFNKAHAASYGMVSYKTAYLKANYPAEYLSACMTAESGDIETCSEYIQEAKRMGFDILPPDVNESFSDFTVVVEDGVVSNKIRFGLRNVKNFGEEIGKAIIAERKAHGKFRTIEDFLERVQHRNLNKKSLEALAMCGALDAFGERGMLMANIEEFLKFHKSTNASDTSQISLFGGMSDEPKAKLNLKQTDETPVETKLLWEKELLGLYVSGHPLDNYEDKIMKTGNNIKNLLEKNIPTASPDAKPWQKPKDKKILIIHIDSIKIITTKNGASQMAFLGISDKTAIAEAVMFPETYKTLGKVIKEGSVMALECTLSNRDGKKSFLIEGAKVL
jgi:DNA polymerase-3 subunit alpha